MVKGKIWGELNGEICDRDLKGMRFNLRVWDEEN